MAKARYKETVTTSQDVKRTFDHAAPKSYSQINKAEVTPRVLAGVKRNQSAVPELFPYRALSATHSFQETEGQPIALRRAKMLKRILEEQPVTIQEGELIIGMKTLKPRGSPLFPEINCTWIERDLDILASRRETPFFVSEETKKILREEIFPYWHGRQIYDRLLEAVPENIWTADKRGVIYNYFTSRTVGHIVVDYNKVLTRGMEGILADIEKSMGRLRCEDFGFILRRQFLQSVAMACEAVVTFAKRHAKEARRLASEVGSAERKAELEKIAAICDRVPAKPARNFHEALQSFWFSHLALNLETDGHSISPGRFDQYLYPFYRKDIDSGELTQAEAQELLDLMWVKFDEITVAKDAGESQTSSSYPDFQNLNIGGLTPDGRDAVNELSFMCLTSLEHVLLPQPGLSAQISTKTQQKFLLRCCEVLRLGTGMPAMFNSDTMVTGMINRGKSLTDARSGSINGCVSPNCSGKDRMASSGYFNLAKCLEFALNDGVDRLTGEKLGPKTGDPADFNSFEQVVEAFRSQVTFFVEMKVHYDNIMRDIYASYCPVPLTSALIDDCIDRALDWHQGGAHYNQAVISGVGVGTVADSLAALKKHVFDGKEFSMAPLKKVLDEDFQGHELLRQTLISKTPHYGNDDDYADDLACLVQKIFCGEVEKHRDIQGAKYWVNLLPTTAHIAMGEATGATPDGRHAGVWLSEGVSPVQGHDLHGPTAATKSVGKLDHARCNGTLLNIKISPDSFNSSEDLQKLAALIRGYFDQGGHHIQFNIIDKKILMQAMEHPDEYRNLLVRVAGYSDYFVLLSPEIQREIISRTEHCL
jgi:pyruvate formate-lyase/glycerol dehydratase family glycyl radical enzyme